MNQKILDLIIKLVTSFFNKSVDVTIPLTVEEAPKEVEPKPQKTEIDWNNPASKISKYFTVKEACWLPSWQTMHQPSEIEKENIIAHAKNMDKVREFLGVPLHVHCWIRPILNNSNSVHNGQDYNALVKGAKNSAHIYGLATDYDAVGLNCDDVRTKLEPKLEEFALRQERMPGGNWIHNDSSRVPEGGNRYFIP